MKRGLSSFDIYVIVWELQDLVGSYIDKIYQRSRNEVFIRVNNKQKNRKEFIYIRNGALVCTTEKKFEVPQRPSTFAMTLRKYLLNGQIREVKQHEFDRIIIFTLQKGQQEFSLICELCSNGNIILADMDLKILAPLVRQQWAHRTIQRNERYIPPPAQRNPFDLSQDDFVQVFF